MKWFAIFYIFFQIFTLLSVQAKRRPSKGTLDGYDEKYDKIFQKDQFKETPFDEHETTFMDHQPNVDTNEDTNTSASDIIYAVNSHTINPDTHKSELNSTFESDILLDPSRLKEVAEWTVGNGVYKRAAKSNNNRQYRWPNKILRYKFERNSKDRYLHSTTFFYQAKAEIESKTCIKLREAMGSQYHIRLMSGTGCYSYVGYLRGINKMFNKKQDVSIGRGCNTKATIVHELLHALGFWHEQSRPDRDKYVKIVWDNIPRGQSNGNFLKHSERDIKDLGVPYDYDSVMHYGDKAFAINRAKPTIVRLNGTGRFGQPRNGGLSQKDAQELNRYYECNRTGTTRRPETTKSPIKTSINTRRPQTLRPTTTRSPTEFSRALFLIKSVGCLDYGNRKGCTSRRSETTIKLGRTPLISTNYLGANAVVVDGKTGRVAGTLTEKRSWNFGYSLWRLKPNKLVFLTVNGRWLKVNNWLKYGLGKIGASTRRSIFYNNSAFAMIGWTGPGRINIVQQVSTYRRKGPSVISKRIFFPVLL
ncbi:astacin-like metalloendopeptidase [Xenia sp. Carnegie-2017]|uniref:astacin-like metalloendopeptidase n=1 Tax=Xenia sp. Carnegie-2017 TaxID=2897299 RepID=UPI001F03969B|nr:astacin-like metalloendopeptidase [Xenia sp. Carnegie-2017]